MAEKFVYNVAKSRANLLKHGIDFEEAQRLWDDRHRLSMSLESRGEERRMLIARYGGCCWSAVYVGRLGAIRLISVRRATKREVSCYDRARNANR
ncbi:BrnT family toxin [Adlercreutzia faecimuris]|uniref:BrnT family toxin n=1 Tax=Adlercreutzia faecimuris TaxID=2897341 RepID=A0ABS9WHW2_9ACTN|nr:BrnT family toxin [Adlercreutzia sp. JBNU-10]MCI2241831.1 BrnT family toxin [Adlercreutzia sp. JBNU-10]